MSNTTDFTDDEFWERASPGIPPTQCVVHGFQIRNNRTPNKAEVLRVTKDSTAVLERPQHDRFNLNAKLYSKDTIYWVQVTLENGNTLKRPARVHAIFKKHGSSDLKDHYFLICWYHHQGDRASWPTWNLPNWEHAEDVNFAEFAHGGFHDVVSGEQMLEDVYGPHLVRGEGKPPKGQCKWDPQMPHDIVEI